MSRKILLPRGWKRRVRSSVLHILALNHYSFTVLLASASWSRNFAALPPRLVRANCLHRVVPARHRVRPPPPTLPIGRPMDLLIRRPRT